MTDPTGAIHPDALYSEADASELLGLTGQALKFKRIRGEGPPFVRLGRRSGIRYRGEDIRSWLAERVESA